MRTQRLTDLIALAALAGLLLGSPASAQEAEDAAEETEAPAPEPAAEEEQAVEEIIVVAPRPGARRNVPIEYEDPERARLLRELYMSREDQAELARLAAIADEQDGRVRLGYNPELDRPDLEDDMQTPQRETTRPATIFTIQF